MTLLTIDAVKKQEIANDGAQVSLTVDARHVGELIVSLPADCFDDLISTLTRAQSMRAGAQRAPASPMPVPPTTAQPTPSEPLAAPSTPVQQADPNRIAVRAPRNWLVTSDVQTHGIVLLIFNHQAEGQAGYALAADAAKKMAEGLVKNADAVLASKTRKQP